MSEAHKPLKFIQPPEGSAQGSEGGSQGAHDDSAIREQMAQHLQLLNSQLVLYARDFRRLVDDQQRKDDELRAVKHQLDQANEQLKDMERQSAKLMRKRDQSKPDISVIMTVFNSEEYLSDAIESIIHQTYRFGHSK